MSERVVRAAFTETKNAYPHMPPLERIADLAGRVGEVRDANIAHHLELARQAAARGARLVCFGELFPGPYFAITQEPVWFDLAEDAREGPTSRAVCAAAKELGLVLVAPIYELEAQTGKRFNTALVADADGELLGSFRKVHIPNGWNEQGVFAEAYYYERSDGRAWNGPKNRSRNPYFPVWETAIGRLGVGICYDRHFEGITATLAKNGAELVVFPAVTFGNKSRRMWELEFEVDACRHWVFVGGSNRRGSEPPWNQEFFGASFFCGPNGRLPNLSDDPRLVISDIDLEELQRPDPSGWALRRDARPEIY
ncbi:MAG: nitrilase-related carbon-nitrogen hydrolase [Planctomycetota bacterium]